MISYDDECEKLAEYFLNDYRVSASEPTKRGLIEQLAEHIQKAVEDWLETELP